MIDVSLLLNQPIAKSNWLHGHIDPLLDRIINTSIQQGNTVILFDRDGVGGIESTRDLSWLIG